MPHFRVRTPVLLAALAFVVACDDDPTQPIEVFDVSCPTGLQSVNEPILLDFTVPLSAATVAPGNVVVTDARTGQEIPGSISLNTGGDSTEVTFTPSSAFRFDQQVRIRVQNLRSARTNTPLTVAVCDLRTELPPITELVWRQIPNASSSELRGISLLAGGLSHVMTVEGALYRRQAPADFSVFFQSPFNTGGSDVDFLTPQDGFASFRNTRDNFAVVLHTTNSGVSYDTVATVTGVSVNVERIWFEPGATAGTYFGSAGGGTSASAFFLKFAFGATPGFTRQNFSGTGAVNDIDFPKPDTLRGAAVSRGVRVGVVEILGGVFTTENGGVTWTKVRTASSQALTLLGVARRADGTIYVTGGNGYFARLTPGVGGTYTETRLLTAALVNPDTTDPLALLFTDVQFASDNPQVGWVIGKQRIGVVGGTPRYQGFIFRTTDGGATFTRQGVIGAANYGAEFPGLNRLAVLTSTEVQIAGDGGTVLEYTATP